MATADTAASGQRGDRVRRGTASSDDASRGRVLCRRDDHRVVRLLPVRRRGGAGLPAEVLPGSDPYVATLLAFSTYFVGFVARPVGAALFGHYGDRIGRKTALIATLVLMGVATVGDRPRARLQPHRHLGRGAVDLLPRPAGHRRRRRMGRRGADRGGVDRPEAARLHDQLRAVRGAGGHGARQRRARPHVRSSRATRRS